MPLGYVYRGMNCSSCRMAGMGTCGRCRIRRYSLGESATDSIMSSLTSSLLPQLKDVVAKASEAAEPTIRKVVIEDVLPKFGTAVVLGLVGGAIAAAAIGAWVATRRSRR